jgi:hypothetical protein
VVVAVDLVVVGKIAVEVAVVVEVIVQRNVLRLVVILRLPNVKTLMSVVFMASILLILGTSVSVTLTVPIIYLTSFLERIPMVAVKVVAMDNAEVIILVSVAVVDRPMMDYISNSILLNTIISLMQRMHPTLLLLFHLHLHLHLYLYLHLHLLRVHHQQPWSHIIHGDNHWMNFMGPGGPR